MRQRQRGLSLVEILVVLALAAMVAGIVVINAPPPRGDLRKTADALAARLEFAAETAVTQGTVLGMRLEEDGYEFYRYGRGEWKAETQRELIAGSFPAEFSVAVETQAPAKKNEDPNEEKDDDDDEDVIRPDLRFLPTGETTPVSVVFQNQREHWRVTLDGLGHVEVSNEEGA